MLWSVLFACGPQLSATPEAIVIEELATPPAALVGLTPDDGELHLYDLGRTTGVNAGVQLDEDGLWAHAGMKGFTCDLWTRDGSVAADLDYPGNGDEVIDGIENRLLVRTDEGLFVTRFGQHTASGQLEEPFLADAKLVDGGVVTLAEEAEGCRVGWFSQVDAPDSETFVDDSWCTGGVVMLAERDTGTVWLLDAEQLTQVTPDGEHVYDIGGDHLAWDPVHGQAWIASTGEHGATSVDPDGGWTLHETAGPVQSLGSLGLVGALVVGSPGSLEVLWGETGEAWGSYSGMVQPDGDLESSDSGAVLGVQDGTTARFFLGEVF
jgi:hypothetical protein